MPQPHILKITEIFPSIAGEGLRSGEPTIFVRLAGCNLRCAFCDTKYSWQGGKSYSVDKIIETVGQIRKRFPADWVCLTGGEPLLQEVKPLVNKLKKECYKIHIETNGTIYRPIRVDWMTLSPKPGTYEFVSEFTTKANEVKLVVSKELTLEVIQNLRGKIPAKTPILLQPQSNRKWSMDLGMKLLKRAMNTGLKNIRISVQLHKCIGVR
ncbi:MAG: 7-carboxy-7-deazaguanine synthase QueE [Candidatus Aminicenantes bacterium]|nr:7-carboxy-7-deazaguanine synthase QueE [Candidatus Aminicenantes bacterium]